MPTSIINVYNARMERPEERARVTLEWNGIVNLGQSKSVYTNHEGRALVEDSSTGPATVYVNGSKVAKFDLL